MPARYEFWQSSDCNSLTIPAERLPTTRSEMLPSDLVAFQSSQHLQHVFDRRLVVLKYGLVLQEVLGLKMSRRDAFPKAHHLLQVLAPSAPLELPASV